jgi:hypothetical protein
MLVNIEFHLLKKLFYKVEFYNIDTKRVIKQTINSRCIGYVINENSNL